MARTPSIELEPRRRRFGRGTRTNLYPLLVLCAACHAAPAARVEHPAETHAAVPQPAFEAPRSTAPPAPPDAGETREEPAPPALESPSESPAPAEDEEQALTPSEASAMRNPVFVAPYLWFCMHWLHLRDDSNDCFTTLKECRAERRLKDGPVPIGCHAQRGTVWCTLVPGQPGIQREQRCFGFPKYCDKYRQYLAASGFLSSECTEVPSKP